MKKLFLMMALLVLFGLTSLSAATFPFSLPGGKNYLDPENMFFADGRVSLSDPILIKPNTDYVLSFPGDALIDDVTVEIVSSTTSYLNGEAAMLPACSVTSEFTTCQFTSDGNEQYLEIQITGFNLDQYIFYYGYDQFQLEEGTVRTAYEPYVAPYTDVTSPEFSGNAAFVKAYYESYPLSQIIADHIYVYDDIDGDLTDQIVVTHDEYSANMNTAGEYDVTLEASDSSGNTSSFGLTILVKDELAPDIIGPTTITTPVDDQMTIEALIAAHYAATDGHDGALPITVVSDAYTANMTMLGSYAVELAATDASGNTTSKTIDINVVDLLAPTLESDSNITIVLSNPQDLTMILDQLVIQDNYDSAASLERSVIADQYTSNELSTGTYVVEVSYTDASFNTALFVLNITIVDDIAPTITGTDTISTSYTTAPTMSELLDELIVADNHDLLDINDLVIVANTYGNRSETVGDFYVEYELQDDSGNVATHRIDITLVDDQAPSIYVDNFLITVTPDASFSPMDALNLLMNNADLPVDDYDIMTLRDEYTGHEDQPGVYEYQLRFVASDGTTYDREFIIKVPESSPVEMDRVKLIRNALTYSGLIGFTAFVVIKQRKS